MRISFRTKQITEMQELQEVVALQEQVWGSVSIVPVSQLIAAIHNGGIVFGAVEQKSDRIVGFCYGFPGFHPTEGTYLYSHMLAIHADYRNYGIGKQLKLAQRKWALQYGYTSMKWTVDPLEMKNGYLNLCKLGGISQTYIPEFYGQMQDKVNKGISSDRLVLEWVLDSNRTEQAIQGNTLTDPSWHHYKPLLHWELADGLPKPKQNLAVQSAEGYLLAVPADIQQLKKADAALVQEWRLQTRKILMDAFQSGYTLIGVLRGETAVHHYVLEK